MDSQRDNIKPLVMEESYWANSMLSVARHSGGVRFKGNRYIVVDRYGRDLWTASIPPGEPADLIYEPLQAAYKALGRDEVIRMVKEGKTFSTIMQTVKDRTKKPQRPKQQPLSLF